MSSSRVDVTVGVRSKARLPDWAAQYALLAVGLESRGVFADVLDRLRVRRKSGYVGVDVFAFLLLYFTAKRDGGFKGLTEDSRPWAEELGALAGRERLMTQQSLSRFFSRVEAKHVDAKFMRWLLVEAADCGELLQTRVGAISDSRGQRWRFFDLDGTLLALRRRGLPEYRDLPEPERLVDDSFAVEGYAGRKRADLQMCRETLQDAGTGLWLGVWCSPGDGDKKQSVSEAAKMVASVMRDCESPDRCVIRSDGAYGTWEVLEACAKRNVGYLTRWSRYELLSTEKVIALREQGNWERVRDSRSGPTRFAIELGYLDSPDGQHRTRLVCSRYRDETSAGVGCSLEGWRYEIFATSLPAADWSAAQTVYAYYGRVGQENRFGQEDNELRLDVLFSKNIQAQALATIVGLFVWNLQTVAGWKLSQAEPVPKLPSQLLRVVEPQADDIQPRQSDTLVKLLEENVDWSTSLKPGWSWEPGHGLRCPAGSPMYLKRVRNEALIFRAPLGACRGCPHRNQCTNSTQPRYRRELQVKTNTDIKAKIRACKRRRLKSTIPHPSDRDRAKPTTERWNPPTTAETGTLEVAGPYLIPTELRHLFRRLARLEVTVDANYSLRQSLPRHLVPNDARRQRRRLTWAERNAWNALPDDATVQVRFAGWCETDIDRVLASVRAKGVQPVAIAA